MFSKIRWSYFIDKTVFILASLQSLIALSCERARIYVNKTILNKTIFRENKMTDFTHIWSWGPRCFSIEHTVELICRNTVRKNTFSRFERYIVRPYNSYIKGTATIAIHEHIPIYTCTRFSMWVALVFCWSIKQRTHTDYVFSITHERFDQSSQNLAHTCHLTASICV